MALGKHSHLHLHTMHKQQYTHEKKTHQNRFEYKSKTCISIADGTILYVETNKNEMETTKPANSIASTNERTSQQARNKIK